MRELTMDEMDVVSGGEYNLIGSGWSTAWSAAGGGGTANWNLALLPGETLIDVSATRLSSPFFPNIGGSGGSDILDFGIEDPEIVVTAPPARDWCGNDTYDAPDWADIGIYIGDACMHHDQNYGENSTMDRSDADALLRREIFTSVINQGGTLAQAATIATAYWLAVRLGSFPAWGTSYQGRGNPF